MQCDLSPQTSASVAKGASIKPASKSTLPTPFWLQLMRQINWDATPDATSALNELQANFQLWRQSRGSWNRNSLPWKRCSTDECGGLMRNEAQLRVRDVRLFGREACERCLGTDTWLRSLGGPNSDSPWGPPSIDFANRQLFLPKTQDTDQIVVSIGPQGSLRELRDRRRLGL